MNQSLSTFGVLALAAAATLLPSAPASAAGTLTGAVPLVIGHRGASGYRPEHTLAAYDLAISQGANYIEPDLVMTKDGELLARHEPMLARVNLDSNGNIALDINGRPTINRTDTSTNVWELPQYAGRLTVKTLDGVRVGGWWAEDFTAAEIRRDVLTQERLRDLRVGNNAYNNQFPIPTLQEVVDLAKTRSVQLGRTIGVYPETKHPTFTAAHTQANGLMRMEDRLLQVLHSSYGNTGSAPVFIQSFEVSNLRYMAGLTNLNIVQLISFGGKPYDFTVAGDPRTYATMATPAGLEEINDYAKGVGLNTNVMIPLTASGTLGTPTTVVGDAHAKGLLVHGWTFRAENVFLPNEFDLGTSPGGIGNMGGQVQDFLALGMDGFFTDHPDLGVAAVVPEPGTWALMLAGGALLATRLRRRG